LKNKSLKRLGLITNNTLRQILISVFSMVIPFLVIHFSSKEIWGSFVAVYLYCLLVLQIINWGNKEYLLRKFSKNPREISLHFSENMATRFPLVILFFGIGLFLFPISFGLWILIWLLGRYFIHSTEVLVFYEKKFNRSILIELITFGFFGILFYLYKNDITVYRLLVIFSLYQFLKGILYFGLFKNWLTIKTFSFKINYFKTAFPFFILSILGFLGSKIDLYIIESLESKTITAEYQVINSLLVFCMSITALVYSPFTKLLYRNTDQIVDKAKNILAYIGLIVVPVSLLIIYFVLELYLKVDLEFYFYLIAFAYVYPCYVYGLDIINLFKQHKEKTVVIILTVGVILNSLLSALFLYLGYGIIGALSGSAIAQMAILVLIKLKNKL
jgi:O-antigen/teichoic acid export membrane protein